MRRETERQHLMVALIWVCFLALLYAGLLSPYFSAEREAARAERDAARAVLARTEVYQRTVHADVQAEDKLHLREARLAAALPEEHAQGAFFSSVERSARHAGVTLVRMVPQPAVSDGEIVRQRAEVHVSGDYFALISFLREVESGERTAVFKALSLTADGTMLRAVITLETAALAAHEQQGT